MRQQSRREFLADVGRGTLATSVGYGLALEMGLTPVLAAEEKARLNFGDSESLVGLMQDTPAAKLQTLLVEKMKSGTSLLELVKAGALANARTFGGEDYVGFHTMMALAPAYCMSKEMPAARAALPVLKVLYRNTARMQEFGGSSSEVLHPVAAVTLPEGQQPAEFLHAAVRSKDAQAAEQAFATVSKTSPLDAFNHLLHAVHDQTEVHRVVLPYRAWDLLGLIGQENAHTLLRQSVRYCVKAEGRSTGPISEPRNLLPKLFDQFKLADKQAGSRQVDDAWVEQFTQTLLSASASQSAEAAAAALAEGVAPDAVGEAIVLAANQLVLRDVGRTAREEWDQKPLGSVHGDSIGVHACDSANAWRNMARVSNTRNQFACLILGAYQVALDRVQRGGDFTNWKPLPWQQHTDRVRATDAAQLLREAELAIRDNLQVRTMAIVQRYGEQGHAERPMFDLMLKFATSEDGALHAEKFYRTCSEEFAASRAAFKWRYLVGLSRVTASEFGRPAAGQAEATELLGLAKS